MYIIDRNKDYYDYLSHIYGVDKKVVYDRRGSQKITDETIASFFHDNYYRNRDDNFIILEVGFVQYLVRVCDIKYKKNYLDDETFSSCKMEIMYEFHNNTHLYKTPLSIRGVDVNYRWGWKEPLKYILTSNYKETITRVYENPIDSPIIAETQITRIISSEEIWRELQTYISSLNNDADVNISMTDVEKAEIHGFDKKTSFRNPIKYIKGEIDETSKKRL